MGTDPALCYRGTLPSFFKVPKQLLEAYIDAGEHCSLLYKKPPAACMLANVCCTYRSQNEVSIKPFCYFYVCLFLCLFVSLAHSQTPKYFSIRALMKAHQLSTLLLINGNDSSVIQLLRGGISPAVIRETM